MTVVDVTIANWRTLDLESGQVAMWWLGQAGFLLSCRQGAIVIDPYLSDSLSEKYRGGLFEHMRMMPIPVAPSQLTGIDWIFSSHRHTDHMDVGTLPPLMAVNPGCRFFCPAAAADHAESSLGMAADTTTALTAGDRVELADSVSVDVIASAHEELQFDDRGNSIHLGFVFTIDGTRIYHSGDCTPYDGLLEKLKRFEIDVALPPVNGRDEYRTSNGIIGNFTLDEAVDLCHRADIPAMVPHHFGMFDFNTIDPQELSEKVKATTNGPAIVVPEVDKAIVTRRS